MSKIQETLDSLQPYVIGIRYLKGVPVVDIVLTEGWTVPEDTHIKRVKGDETMNYHMIFSDEPGIGLDELLAYVDKTIKSNLDREKKHDLLRAKVNELKEIFKKNTLIKLQKLKFSFGEEDLMPSISDIDDDLEVEHEKPISRPKQIQVDEPYEEDIIDEPSVSQPQTYLDENKQPIQLTDEDREILAEEARAERNIRAMEAKKRNPLGKKVELPPKRKPEMVANEREYHSDTDCDCGPNDACDKCIDSKGY